MGAGVGSRAGTTTGTGVVTGGAGGSAGGSSGFVVADPASSRVEVARLPITKPTLR